MEAGSQQQFTPYGFILTVNHSAKKLWSDRTFLGSMMVCAGTSERKVSDLTRYF